MIYAAADIEWVGLNRKMPVQIGALLIDENGKELSTYYRVIKPPLGSRWRNIDFMGLSDKMFESAVSLTAAVKSFFGFTQNCSRIYVWGKESEYLLDNLRNSICPEYETEITAVQGSSKNCSVSFKKVCQSLDIPVTKQLHNSMHDCEYLAEILRRLNLWDKSLSVHRQSASVKSDFLKYVKREETRAPVKECAFAAIKGRITFHYPQCRYIYDRNDDELEGFFDYAHAAMQGRKPCKCCRPRPESSKLSSPSKSPVKWDTDSIIEQCCRLGLKCTVYEKIIYIYTGVSEWYFYRNVGKIRIYHENWLRSENQSRWASGFHIQDKVFSDPNEAVFYIYCHDKKLRRAKEKMMQNE